MAKRLKGKQVILQTLKVFQFSGDWRNVRCWTLGDKIYFDLNDVVDIRKIPEHESERVQASAKWHSLGDRDYKGNFFIEYKDAGVIREVVCEYLIPDLEELYEIKIK